MLPTVLIEPIVCSAMVAAVEYEACPRDAKLPTTLCKIAPEITNGGIEDNNTNVSSHPLTKATTKPPVNAATCCMKLPTCHGPKQKFF